jgi:hypothetical protein
MHIAMDPQGPSLLHLRRKAFEQNQKSRRSIIGASNSAIPLDQLRRPRVWFFFETSDYFHGTEKCAYSSFNMWGNGE